MTVPSQTPEAAGLEVVAWMMRQTNGVHSYACITPCDDSYIDEGWFTKEPLVTAASAQAAIDAEKAKVAELEALVASIRRAQRDVIRAEIEQEGYSPISDANDRATAAEARADRLAKALDDCRLMSRQAEVQAVARAALQQETQP